MKHEKHCMWYFEHGGTMVSMLGISELTAKVKLSKLFKCSIRDFILLPSPAHLDLDWKLNIERQFGSMMRYRELYPIK